MQRHQLISAVNAIDRCHAKGTKVVEEHGGIEEAYKLKKMCQMASVDSVWTCHVVCSCVYDN